YLERFEAEFCAYTGLKHAVAVSSGTAALHLALHMLGLEPGARIAAPTLTFIGGVAPLRYVGAEPVFVDSEPDSWGMDPALLDQACAQAAREGRPIRAVVPADLYGQACDLDAIRAVAEAHGAVVVLDAAESVGSHYKGRHVGPGASCAAFSFNGNKIITTGGGGMLSSDDGDLIARARKLATAARETAVHYEHAEVGFNYRLSSLSAALGIAQLEGIEGKVARRRAIFDRYRTQLAEVPGLTFAPEAQGRRHTRWLSVVLLEADARLDREGLRRALDAAGIEARPVWKPMHLQPVFAGATVSGGAVAEDLFDRGLCLPSGSDLDDFTIDRVCDAIRTALI
ncbi:MAG: aminotransferase class I/II-fold pyridoxal phosphate-dependent enzyme, partial [Brevundimonas sp.]